MVEQRIFTWGVLNMISMQRNGGDLKGDLEFLGKRESIGERVELWGGWRKVTHLGSKKKTSFGF